MSGDDGLVARLEAERRRRLVAATTPVTADSASPTDLSAEAAAEADAPVEYFASVVASAKAEATADAVLIPAADRFVSIDHNSPAYKETVEVLGKLEEAVRGSNDLFADPAERLAVIREVRGVRELISEQKVRVAAVWSAVTGNGVIVFLATAFATGAIHEFAAEAMKWLSALISP